MFFDFCRVRVVLWQVQLWVRFPPLLVDTFTSTWAKKIQLQSKFHSRGEFEIPTTFKACLWGTENPKSKTGISVTPWKLLPTKKNVLRKRVLQFHKFLKKKIEERYGWQHPIRMLATLIRKSWIHPLDNEYFNFVDHFHLENLPGWGCLPFPLLKIEFLRVHFPYECVWTLHVCDEIVRFKPIQRWFSSKEILLLPFQDGPRIK